MSIFPKEVQDKFAHTITVQSLDALEVVLMSECKMLGIPYTRAYLKTIVHSLQRFIKLGISEHVTQEFCGTQVSWLLHVEKLLERFEYKIQERIKQHNEDILS